MIGDEDMGPVSSLIPVGILFVIMGVGGMTDLLWLRIIKLRNREVWRMLYVAFVEQISGLNFGQSEDV